MSKMKELSGMFEKFLISFLGENLRITAEQDKCDNLSTSLQLQLLGKSIGPPIKFSVHNIYINGSDSLRIEATVESLEKG